MIVPTKNRVNYLDRTVAGKTFPELISLKDKAIQEIRYCKPGIFCHPNELGTYFSSSFILFRFDYSHIQHLTGIEAESAEEAVLFAKKN